MPVTTDFWSVSRRKQVTLCGGVWKHVLSEACWMIAWRQGRRRRVSMEDTAGTMASSWRKTLSLLETVPGVWNGWWKRGEGWSWGRLIPDADIPHRSQTGPVFYPLSPHVFITGVQVTSVFFFPLLCGQAKNTVYLNIPKKLKSLLKGQTVPQIVANVG